MQIVYNKITTPGRRGVFSFHLPPGFAQGFVMVVAPGVDIKSTRKDNTYGKGGGTSYASPQVAGTAGLIASRHPDFTSQDIEEVICLTAEKLEAYTFTDGYEHRSWNNEVGYGKLNADRAIGIKEDITSNITLKEGNYIRNEVHVSNNSTLTLDNASRVYLIKTAILTIDQGSYVNCEEEILLQGDNPYNTTEVYGELNLEDNNQIGVDITVKPGGTLTIPANKTVNLVNDANIIIENTDALVVGDNATRESGVGKIV